MEFDLNKLKKRPSYPFETIAVGLSFSPRMESVLAEAKKISDVCGSKLILIHVGAKTIEKEKVFSDILFRNNIEEKKVKVIWAEGDEVNTMLQLCKQNIVLLTNPSKEARPAKKIIVNAGVDHPKTIHSINTALYFAKKMGVKEISLVHEVHSPTLSMAMAESSSAPEVTKMKKEFTEEESNKLHSLIAKCETDDLKINEKVIKGKPGFAIRQYAETKKADLLVINSPDTNLTLLDRIFTHDIEFILADMPCNLLIVHSRI